MKQIDYYYLRSLAGWSKVRCAMLIATALFAAQFLYAQQKTYTVKGTVRDREISLPGTSVLIEGTSTGTITDPDGNYQLSVTTDQPTVRLVFSSIGYRQQILPVNLGSSETITLDVVLEEDIQQLDEVVVTGSTLRTNKRELGNSINTVSGSALERSGSSNLFGALQGKVPGAQITQNSGDPSGGITIRLRGVKSLQGSSDPLYVIDGVIVSNSTVNVSQTALTNQVGGPSTSLGTNRLVDINPADIES